MGEQTTQKYIPTEYAREKNTYVEEFFSAPDVEITINDENIKYINAIQFAINEQLKPVYGYQSRTYDDVAVGTRLVTGVIKVPVKNNRENELADWKDAVPTLLTEEEVKNKRPSWVIDTSLLADVHYRKSIDNEKIYGKLLSNAYVFLEPTLDNIIGLYDKNTRVEISNEFDNCYAIKNDNLAGYIDKRNIKRI